MKVATAKEKKQKSRNAAKRPLVSSAGDKADGKKKRTTAAKDKSASRGDGTHGHKDGLLVQ